MHHYAYARPLDADQENLTVLIDNDSHLHCMGRQCMVMHGYAYLWAGMGDGLTLGGEGGIIPRARAWPPGGR